MVTIPKPSYKNFSIKEGKFEVPLCTEYTMEDMSYLDTPGSTGSHTYQTRGRSDNGACYIGRNRSSATHTIICTELDYS